MSRATVEQILTMIDGLADEDRELLERRLAERLEAEWRREADAARAEWGRESFFEVRVHSPRR